MNDFISSVSAITGAGQTAQATSLNTVNSAAADDSSDFKSVFSELINKVNETDVADKTSNYNLISGQLDNLHDVIIAGEEADLALNLTLQIRNKALDAYNEIMKLQV